MEFQLVIQWPFASVAEYDALIAAEDLLIKNLSDAHDVDGHDAGSGTANIFIITGDVQRAFTKVRATREPTPHWPNARIAYRALDADDYPALWPPGMTDFELM